MSDNFGGNYHYPGRIIPTPSVGGCSILHKEAKNSTVVRELLLKRGYPQNEVHYDIWTTPGDDRTNYHWEKK